MPVIRRGALTARVQEKRLWGEPPFFLLDVGCSGGLDQRWSVFGDRFRAVGFDPLVAEVDRLNAANTHPGVRFEAAFVGCRDFDELFPPSLRQDQIASRNNQPFPRSSAFAAQSRLSTSYVQEQFNAGAPVQWSDKRVTLDDYVDSSEHPRVDFVKIDTDGHDIEVILGADSMMSAGGILGLMVESQFHGAVHDFENTFPNIDRLLRRHGFTLFDLTPYRYSRARLPAPFVWDIAAQTTTGQVLWGEALYLRDLGSPTYDRMWPGYDITPERVLKLACLFDLFDLPDCAAELIINRGTSLAANERDALLDALVGDEPGSYAAHVAAFEADYTSFFRSRRLAKEKQEQRVDDTGSSDVVKQLQARNDELRERLKDRRDKIAKLKTRLDELEARRK
jgi:FkbM family methyltransferase